MVVARRSRVLVDGLARRLSRRAITDWVVDSYIAHNVTCSLCAPHAAGELGLRESGFRAGMDDGAGELEFGAPEP